MKIKVKLLDVVALAGANGLAYLVASQVADESFAALVFVMAAFHLLIGWLVLTADKKTKISASPVQIGLYHLLFVCILMLAALLRDSIPMYVYAQYAFAAVALVERSLLFAGKAPEPKTEIHMEPHTEVRWDSTPEDEKAWCQYLDTLRGRVVLRKGSLADEYKAFIAARVKARVAAEKAAAAAEMAASPKPPVSVSPPQTASAQMQAQAAG